MNKKDLYFFIAHLDDFELSCISYLWKKKDDYDRIIISIASTWEPKVQIWKDNLQLIINSIGLHNVEYANFGFDQRTLMTNFDALKDKFYQIVDFNRRFDIITHDNEDCHTDHIACSMIAGGLYKYSSNFITIYSPSSKNFKANYWIGFSEEIYQLKKKCVDKYDTGNEQSYTKLGYYIKSESHYNIGKTYFLENFVSQDQNYYEVFRIVKRLE